MFLFLCLSLYTFLLLVTLARALSTRRAIARLFRRPRTSPGLPARDVRGAAGRVWLDGAAS